MIKFTALLLAAFASVQASVATAQDMAAPQLDRTTIYIGGGNARSDGDYESDKTPLSFGIMHQLSGRNLILGADLGREGTLLDSTWGQDEAVEPATSFNLLIGANLAQTDRVRTDAG